LKIKFKVDTSYLYNFKKEEINELFIKEVETFLGLMSNRYVDYEDIVTLLKEDLLNNNSNNIGTKKNEIISIFMNKSLLYKELNTVVYDIWKNNNRLGSISNMTKLYYFTKFDIPDLNKITFDFTVFEKILDKNNFIKMNSKYDAKDAPNAVWFIHTYLSRNNFSIPKNTTLINMLNDYSLAYKDKLYQICNVVADTASSEQYTDVISPNMVIAEHQFNRFVNPPPEFGSDYPPNTTWFENIHLSCHIFLTMHTFLSCMFSYYLQNYNNHNTDDLFLHRS
jgi:hypothetical protein